MPKHLVVWAVEVEASSPWEACGVAMEIHQSPTHTATVFMVDGKLVDFAGDDPSENAACYPAVLAPREHVEAAFQRWRDACTKDADGKFVDQPALPTEAADLMLHFLQNKA